MLRGPWGELDGAIYACREALRRDPNKAVARTNLDRVLRVKEDVGGSAKP